MYGGRGCASRTKSIESDVSYLSAIPKKSSFSKSLILMKCSKYLICAFVKHWILNCQSLIENQEKKLVYCRKYWPKETIPPNLHMLKDHAANFIERSLPGRGVSGEHGAESIHKIFKLLQRTYCSVKPATIRLQNMLKKNIIEYYTQMQRLWNL